MALLCGSEKASSPVPLSTEMNCGLKVMMNDSTAAFQSSLASPNVGQFMPLPHPSDTECF